MKTFNDHDEDEVQELLREAVAERRNQQALYRCYCDTRWGTCPGPMNCLYSGLSEEA